MRQISSDSSKKIRSFKGHMLDYLTYKPNFPSSHILRSLYENERIEAVENYEMLFDDLIIDKTINLRGRCADENLFNREKTSILYHDAKSRHMEFHHLQNSFA